MNQDLFDWTYCRSFLAIMQEGSLSRAAVRLRVTHPTMRRHLDALETRLGAKLFVRTTNGLTPTDLALGLQATAEAMQASADAFVRRASAEADQPSGVVRITASETVGAKILPPLLAKVRQIHPALEFELVLTRSVEDLMLREADIAVRMARPVQSDLVAKKVGSLAIKFYAHQDWVDRHGLPTSFARLAAARQLIGYDQDTAFLRAVEERGGRISRSAFGFRSDNDLAQLAAVRAGLGVGLGHAVVMRRYPDLINVLPEIQLPLDVWLAAPPALRSVARVAIVWDALAEGIHALAVSEVSSRKSAAGLKPAPMA